MGSKHHIWREDGSSERGPRPSVSKGQGKRQNGANGFQEWCLKSPMATCCGAWLALTGHLRLSPRRGSDGAAGPPSLSLNPEGKGSASPGPSRRKSFTFRTIQGQEQVLISTPPSYFSFGLRWTRGAQESRASTVNTLVLGPGVLGQAAGAQGVEGKGWQGYQRAWVSFSRSEDTRRRPLEWHGL